MSHKLYVKVSALPLSELSVETAPFFFMTLTQGFVLSIWVIYDPFLFLYCVKSNFIEIALRRGAWVFSCKFAADFQNTFSYEYL